MTRLRMAFLVTAVKKSTNAGQYDRLPPSIRTAVAKNNVEATLKKMHNPKKSKGKVL